jgi:hypothetical protein
LAKNRAKQVKLPFCSFIPTEPLQSCLGRLFGIAWHETSPEATRGAVPKTPCNNPDFR